MCTYGTVGNDDTVHLVKLTVMKSSGAGDINLSTATIEWLGPDQGTILTKGDAAGPDTFAVNAIEDVGGTLSVLVEREDRFRITIGPTALSDDGSDSGRARRSPSKWSRPPARSHTTTASCRR